MNDNDYLKVRPLGAESNRTGYAFDVIKEWGGIVEFKLQSFLKPDRIPLLSTCFIDCVVTRNQGCLSY